MKSINSLSLVRTSASFVRKRLGNEWRKKLLPPRPAKNIVAATATISR
jgi:hypothetical protein